MKADTWLLIDTETTGLRSPIYCVEIAAQMMKGLEPMGNGFRVLLNHDVDIEPAALAVHGYSRDFLRQYGTSPIEAYSSFRKYAGNLPVVSYNLSFDWGRVLEPEYLRLGITQIGQPAFCALTLARRCIYEAENHRLDTLRKLFFPQDSGTPHRAESDVRTTLRLLKEIIWPRLEGAGISSFQDVIEFSRATPVASCVARIRKTTSAQKITSPPSRIVSTDPASELSGLIQGILADDKLVDAELWVLRCWLDEHPQLKGGRADALREIIKRAIADGILTEKELLSLKQLLAQFVPTES